MSRARYGDTITAQKGRFNTPVGGVVYGLNGTKRVFVTPTNPQTAAQGQVRAVFAFLTSAWKGLTQPQRDAWSAARTSGDWTVQDPVSGTARNYNSAKSLFIAVNTNVLLAQNAMSSPAVAFPSPVAKGTPPPISITSFVFDASAGSAVLTFTGSQTSALLVSATQPVSPGNDKMTSVRSRLRNITAVNGTSPAALGTEYVAVHGAITLAAGLKVFWTVEQVDEFTGARNFVASGDSIIVT